jgi:alpha-tubulin suppressor-like RCC1 family protein
MGLRGKHALGALAFAAFTSALPLGCGKNVLVVGAQLRHDAGPDEPRDDEPFADASSDSTTEPQKPDDADAAEAARAEDAHSSSDGSSDATLEGSADAELEAEACAANACGGCTELDVSPGETCGQCGTIVCAADEESTVCNDPGEVAQLTAGGHTCVLMLRGGVRCWGWNDVGQLGNGMLSDVFSPPSQDVIGGVRTVAAGDDYTCVVMQGTGGLRCWGSNLMGQYGNGTYTTDRASPPDFDVLTGVRSVALGQFHLCALLETGGLRCWGGYVLPDGSGTSEQLTPPDSDLLSGVSAVAAGPMFTCAVLNTGGLRCWGNDEFGQLGDGTTTTKTIVPPATDLVDHVVSVGAGYGHICVLRDDSGVRCWGKNDFGQLGDATRTNRLLPPDTDVITGALALAVGGDHTCVLLRDGSVVCWGSNSAGQVGDGTLDDRLSPASAAVGDAVAVSAGSYHTCALLRSGKVKCWGDNWFGSVGIGSKTEAQALPVDVGSLCP